MRRFFSALVLAIGGSLLFASQNPLYDEASAAFRSGDYELAAGKFESLLEQSPDWAPGHVVLGQCYYLLGQGERGDASIRNAATLDESVDVFRAYFNVGQTLYQQKRFDRAIAPLTRALNTAPSERSAITSLRLGHALLMAGRNSQALDLLEQHFKDFGFDYDSAYYMALSCQRLDKYDCALHWLRQAGATEGAGRATHRHVQHLAEWSRYWALHPQNRPRREMLVQQAVEDTEAWYEAEPDQPDARRYHAEMLLVADRAGQAIDLLTPEQPGACAERLLLARAYNATGDAGKAEAHAREAASCDPSLADSHVELAVALVRRLRPEYTAADEVRADAALVEEAIAALEQALGLGSGGTRAETLLADATRTLERLEQTAEDFEREDDEYDFDMEKERLERIRKQCRTLLWKLRDDNKVLTADEQTFYDENDCKQHEPD